MPARLDVPMKMITIALSSMLIGTSAAAGPADRVCAPTSMLKVATHFARAPKTFYRYGEGLA